MESKPLSPMAYNVFGDVVNTRVRVAEGYTELAEDDFADVSGCTAATVAEFIRDEAGEWAFRKVIRGFDTDPGSFAAAMGRDLP